MLFYSYLSSPGYFLRSIFPPISAIAFPSPNPGKSTELVVGMQGVLCKEFGLLIQICVEISASLFISCMILDSLSNILVSQLSHLQNRNSNALLTSSVRT